ncbi:hypothetical protein D3C79_891870 [compost metagenome]
MAGGGIEQRTVTVPTAAKGLVQRDQAVDRGIAIDQVVILLGEQGRLGIEYPLEIRITFTVLGIGQGYRALGGNRRLAEDTVALQGFEQAGRGIVSLTRCLANAVLVDHDQLLQAGILDAHVVGDSTMIEHVPAQARPADQVQGIGRAVKRAC